MKEWVFWMIWLQLALATWNLNGIWRSLTRIADEIEKAA